MISFCGVIVNHVENDFDACRVQAANHGLELRDLLTCLSTAGVLRMRSKKSDCVVAPVIR